MQTFKTHWLATLALVASASLAAAQNRVPAAYAGTSDGTVYRIDLCTGTQDWSRSVAGAVQCVAASRLGTHVLVGTDQMVALFQEDGVLLWTFPTGVNARSLVEQSQLAINASGDYLVAAHSDGGVRLYHRSSATPIWTRFTGAQSVAISWPGNYVFTGGSNGVDFFAAGMNGWDATDAVPSWSDTCNGAVINVDITKVEGSGAITTIAGTANGWACLWDAAGPPAVWSYAAPKGDLMSVALNPLGERAAVADDDSTDTQGAQLDFFSTLSDSAPGWHAADGTPVWTYTASTAVTDDVRAIEFESTAPYHQSTAGEDLVSGGSGGMGVHEHNEGGSTPIWSGTPDRERDDLAFMELDPYPSYVAVVDTTKTGVAIYRTDQTAKLHTFATSGFARSVSMPTGPIAGNVGSNYCLGAPNSFSPNGAAISAWGSGFVAQNDFTLAVLGATPSQFGVFFYGPVQTTPVPFGNGFLCVAGGFTRLNPPVVTDGCGVVQRWVNLTLPPEVFTLLPGTIWNFQFWYRDPAAGGAFFNLSDAVHVPFQ